MFETARAALYPVLPLRDIVVFPHMIVPLFVGREKSVRALEDVMKDDKQILLVTQKNAAQDDPSRLHLDGEVADSPPSAVTHPGLELGLQMRRIEVPHRKTDLRDDCMRPYLGEPMRPRRVTCPSIAHAPYPDGAIR